MDEYEELIPWKFSFGLFDKVIEIIKNWEPEYDNGEKEIKLSLYEELKKELKGQRIIKEYGLERERVDIVVSDNVPIEIKLNLVDKNEIQRALGQLELYLRKWPVIYLILCGDISEDFLFALKKQIEDKYTTDLISYPRIVVIPKGKVADITGNFLEKIDDKSYSIPSIKMLDRTFQVLKSDDYKRSIEIWADDVQHEKDPDNRRLLLAKYLLKMSANMISIISYEIEKCADLSNQEKMEEYIDIVLKTYINNIIKEYAILLAPPKFKNVERTKISKEEIKEARIIIDMILEHGRLHLYEL